MGAMEASSAAALAIHQLQDQLAAVYKDLASSQVCQPERKCPTNARETPSALHHACMPHRATSHTSMGHPRILCCKSHYQEENDTLRTDARAIIDAQHAELAACEAQRTRLEEERLQMQALLRELRAGLEATLADSAALRAAAAAGREARDALAGCR